MNVIRICKHDMFRVAGPTLPEVGEGKGAMTPLFCKVILFLEREKIELKYMFSQLPPIKE